MSAADLSPQQILDGYRHLGVFPMAESGEDATVKFYAPEDRALLSISGIHIPRRLARTVRSAPYTITINTDFEGVINGCAAPGPGREDTWINPVIRDAFMEYHRQGLAHSVEAWDGDNLVGGLYGLALGGLFCGESMFSRARDASKIALVHLCARLHRAGFVTLDSQFVNSHLEQFGVFEVSQEDYVAHLPRVTGMPVDFLLKDDALARDEAGLARWYFDERQRMAQPAPAKGHAAAGPAPFGGG